MATLTIRNLPDDTLAKFRVLAAGKGRSMEAEARALIEEAARPHQNGPGTEDRVARAQAIALEAFGGVMPTGVVDELLADRRAAAARGD